MKSFDDFKEYHNANYHDGDNTFDSLVYKKTNGEDFDNQFIQDCYDHFEAGQQSRQAEIDELLKREGKPNDLYHFENNHLACANQQYRLKNEELQKRIDEAWSWCEKGCVLKAMEILKGKTE